MDRLFAPLPPDAVTAANRSIFGEFPIDGDAPVGELAAFYDLKPANDLIGLTVREAFALRYPGRLRPGSRIDVGTFAAIVVREVDGQSLVRAGLRLDDIADLSMSTLAPRKRPFERIIKAVKRRRPAAARSEPDERAPIAGGETVSP
jgi:cell volume regulation protein A